MAKIVTVGTRTFAANPAANTHAFRTTARRCRVFTPRPALNIRAARRIKCRQDGGNRIGADQNPEEIAVDEL